MPTTPPQSSRYTTAPGLGRTMVLRVSTAAMVYLRHMTYHDVTIKKSPARAARGSAERSGLVVGRPERFPFLPEDGEVHDVPVAAALEHLLLLPSLLVVAAAQAVAEATIL